MKKSQLTLSVLFFFGALTTAAQPADHQEKQMDYLRLPVIADSETATTITTKPSLIDLMNSLREDINFVNAVRIHFGLNKIIEIEKPPCRLCFGGSDLDIVIEKEIDIPQFKKHKILFGGKYPPTELLSLYSDIYKEYFDVINKVLQKNNNLFGTDIVNAVQRYVRDTKYVQEQALLIANVIVQP